MENSSNPSNAIGLIRPFTVNVEASYTRPADTTTYTAGDVVCNSTSSPVVLTFAGMARGNGLGGIIQNARIIFDQAPTLKLDSELYLFDTSPTIQNDNAAWAPSTSDLGKCIAMIPFAAGSFRTGGANGLIDVQNLSIAFQCAAASSSLFGILVARNAYVPASAAVLKVRLTVIQD